MTIGFTVCMLLVAPQLWAKTYLIAENMSSSLNVTVAYKISIPSGITKLSINSVRFPHKSNPASMQKIIDSQFIPSVRPTNTHELTDQWGNNIIVRSWSQPPSYLSAIAKYRITLDRYLKKFQGEFPYPITSLPEKNKMYLQPSDLIQSNSNKIQLLAEKLLKEVKYQVQAVSLVLNFVVDHISYRVNPSKYDALYTLKNGIGNCQNYAHLSAALLRSGGIPVRIVTGITAKKGWEARTGTSSWNIKLGQGRHAWLEVYYPNFGWVGYDPQQTLNFVSTRHIAIEVGPDAYDASTDGAIVWTSSGNMQPSVEENIAIKFERDKETFSTIGEQPSPRNNLFSSPFRTAALKPTSLRERPKKPTMPHYTLEEIKQFSVYSKRVFGNLTFPHLIDIFSRSYHDEKGAKTLRRSFVSETAEYVTSHRKYSQKIEIPYPLKLYDISLALHKFGGQKGFLWLTVMKDEHNKPVKRIAKSNMIHISRIGFFNGYQWIPFSFTDNILLPGSYWISLEYSVDAIFNWFYLLGNPYKGPDDTRSCPREKNTWDTLQNYDFNFRVRGYELRR
ncbi:MAG: transglutaminase domain-containing protein [Deltaproteobacteria bacterium]|nr:transglutaminase domain-containing protein [Deltaproteobacteria bacterium]